MPIDQEFQAVKTPWEGWEFTLDWRRIYILAKTTEEQFKELQESDAL
jgi:hypothetical protein